MSVWMACVWGLLGAAAVEAHQLHSDISRVKNYPWRARGEVPLGPYLFALAIRLALGVGLAAMFGASGQAGGPVGVAAVGVAAPKVLEQLAGRGLTVFQAQRPEIPAAGLGEAAPSPAGDARPEQPAPEPAPLDEQPGQPAPGPAPSDARHEQPDAGRAPSDARPGQPAPERAPSGVGPEQPAPGRATSGGRPEQPAPDRGPSEAGVGEAAPEQVGPGPSDAPAGSVAAAGRRPGAAGAEGTAGDA